MNKEFDNMNIKYFNKKGKEEVRTLLFQCCGSSQWTNLIMRNFPFLSLQQLVENATNIWYDKCQEADWLEAFGHHPKIGDVASLEKRFAATKHLAGQEQEGVQEASKESIYKLANANVSYEHKNGFIFIVCATGKSAEEMLRILEERLGNSTDEELHIAMGEQHKITIIRLKTLLSDSQWEGYEVSQLTTHVLDTSLGKPGQDMSISLQEIRNKSWQTISQGITNSNGRISDLLPPGRILVPKKYRMVFETGDYFRRNNTIGFYPVVEIQFVVTNDQHYHVPLLINPYGYSTYRGS